MIRSATFEVTSGDRHDVTGMVRQFLTAGVESPRGDMDDFLLAPTGRFPELAGDALELVAQRGRLVGGEFDHQSPAAL